MQNQLPPLLPTPRPAADRRYRVTLKLFLIAGLVLLLQAPLHLINSLQQERRAHHGYVAPMAASDSVPKAGAAAANRDDRFEPYRIVERALKHSVLVLVLVYAAFFLFELRAGLRLHAVHYGLVGAAMCLFYLALLALGEVLRPAAAYAGAAGASSLMITLYSVAILKSGARAAVIAGLLGVVHGVLFVVLRMENFALLAGTGALFAALGAVMFLTRDVDWHSDEPAGAARPV